jgi:hypothetical protein
MNLPVVLPKHYHYRVEGKAPMDQTWSVDGDLCCDWCNVMEYIMVQTHHELKSGKALLGKTGVKCRGPFEITRMIIKQMP